VPTDHYCDAGWHGHVIDECPDEWAAWSRVFLDPPVAAGS
jgi:hypothetical protein